MFHIFFPNWHLPMSPESRNGNIKPEKRSAALQQDVLCASLLPPAVCFSPGRLFNQWSESAHQQKSWCLSHLQRQKSKSHTFIRSRLCKDCCSGGLFLMGGRVRRRACECTKWSGFFFLFAFVHRQQVDPTGDLGSACWLDSTGIKSKQVIQLKNKTNPPPKKVYRKGSGTFTAEKQPPLIVSTSFELWARRGT